MLTSLLKTTHNIYLAHDHNLSSCIVFLDISKAFDRVVHTNLLLKLKQMVIVGSLLTLLTSYLENRSHVVRSNGSTSEICYTNCGVPQDSILGPLLFLISTTFLIIFTYLFLYLLMIQLCIFHPSSQATYTWSCQKIS